MGTCKNHAVLFPGRWGLHIYREEIFVYIKHRFVDSCVPDVFLEGFTPRSAVAPVPGPRAPLGRSGEEVL